MTMLSTVDTRTPDLLTTTDAVSRDGLDDLPRDNRGRRLLVHQVREHAVDLDDPHAGLAQVARTRIQVTERLNANGTVTLVHCSSKLTKGKTRPYLNGQPVEQKTFARWTNDPYVSLTDRGDGSWLLVEQSGYETKVNGKKRWINTGFRSRIVLADQLDRGLAGPPLLSDAAVRLFGRPVGARDYYPLLGYFVPNYILPTNIADGHNPQWASGPIRRTFSRSTDARSLTLGLFGTSRFRKDLMKAVAQSDLSRIEMAWQFRGLVPIDWIIAYLRRPAIAMNEQSNMANINVRPYLRHLDQQSLKNLLYGPDPHMRSLADLVRGKNPAAAAHVGRVRDWTHLHNQIARYNRTHRHTGGKRLPGMRLTTEQKALVGVTESGLSVHLARHEDELWEWGTEMDHCILDYGQQMRARTSWLGAVRSTEGKLVANFEIRKRFTQAQETRGEDATSVMELVQLLGKHNSRLDTELRTQVEEHLASNGVKVPDAYWGSPDRRLPTEVPAAAVDDDDDGEDDDY